MANRQIAPWLAAAMLIAATPGWTQTQKPDAKQQPPAAGQSEATKHQAQGEIKYITKHDANTWKASDLIGMDVYSTSNQDIGEVNDVLVNRDGQVAGLVIDVGGFLGIGEAQVAIPFQAAQFRTADQTKGTGGTANQPGMADSDAGMPERIVLNVTEEQLRAAPRFEADGAGSG